MAPSPSIRGAQLLFFTVSTVLSGVEAYSWSFQSPPAQCSNLTINIADGSSPGTPPFRILIIPTGPSPLPNNVEVRKIMDVPFPDGQKQVTFDLPYPENSQFVAVVSDAKGFGSGGTSVIAIVSGSKNSSCFNASSSVSPKFVFNIFPLYNIIQCVSTRLWWDPTTVQGTPNFLGVIPGGESFSIPQGSLSNVTGQGLGFSWTPSVRGGTSLLLVAGDNRGNGTGGSSPFLVASNVNNDDSCLNNNSPSSTPGSPAGGSYPTSLPSNGGGGSSGGSSSNAGAIAGGVVGGLAALIIALVLLWFFKRRNKVQRRNKERPMDLLNPDDDEEEEGPAGSGPGSATRRNELPQFYQPEPFMVPDPTHDSASTHGGTQTGTMTDADRPLSGTASSFYTRATTPDPYGAATVAGSSAQGNERRKGGAPRPMRAVNYIQHDDAGPSLPVDKEETDEPMTIELPPAYTAVRRDAASQEGMPTPTPQANGTPNSAELPPPPA